MDDCILEINKVFEEKGINIRIKSIKPIHHLPCFRSYYKESEIELTYSDGYDLDIIEVGEVEILERIQNEKTITLPGNTNKEHIIKLFSQVKKIK